MPIETMNKNRRGAFMRPTLVEVAIPFAVVSAATAAAVTAEAATIPLSIFLFAIMHEENNNIFSKNVLPSSVEYSNSHCNTGNAHVP